jgi:hypothetical protein
MGATFLIIQLQRDYLYQPGFYRQLADGLGIARNIYGFRIMLSYGFDRYDMIRTPSQQMVDDWRTFVNYRDDSGVNTYIDPESTFGKSVLGRTVDVYQFLTEPSGDYTYFNPFMGQANAELKNAVGPGAIGGFSDGDFLATDAVELLPPGEAAKFNQMYPNSAVVIHPFKLDNWKYEKQDEDFTNDDRPDPMLYLKDLKDKGIFVIVGETGMANDIDDDWKMNKDWLLSFFQYCEDNKIPYAANDGEAEMQKFWKKIKERQMSRSRK